MANGLSGMSDEGAREFHKLFVVSFLLFTAIAVVAHFLVWQWRPWLPGEGGYAALSDGLNALTHTVLTRLS